MFLLILLHALASSSAFAAPSMTGSWFQDVGLERGVGSSFTSDQAFMPVSSSCKAGVLAALGWKIERKAEGNQVLYTEGNPCDNMSLDDSLAEGELRLQIPDGISEENLQAALDGVLGTQASVCAYKFRVGPAAARATNALHANRGYYFFSGGFPLIEFSRPELWTGACRTGSGKGCFYPRVSNSKAMEEFVSGRIGTECALGLQAAEYATLRELYGDLSFNEQFRPKEITLAAWSILTDTESATWGQMTSADTITDVEAENTSKLGAAAFTGVTGYIGNVYGEDYLDSPVDRGENYLTTAVSPEAAAALASRGGFADFNRMNKRAFELGQKLSPELEKLALSDIDPGSINMSSSQRTAFTELQGLLANPVYSGYRVFVHPLGSLTFGEHIVRLLRLNPRTPYTFQLYPSRMNRGQYTRYVNSLLSNCR